MTPPLSLIVPARDIPPGRIVYKPAGQKAYKLHDQLPVYTSPELKSHAVPVKLADDVRAISAEGGVNVITADQPLKLLFSGWGALAEYAAYMEDRERRKQ